MRKTIRNTAPVKKPVRTGKDDVVRWVALGGLEEIGRNMMFFEYKNEIVIVDAGLQFPEEETPGIDYIIPNVSYLETRKEKIKALIVTHGHYDHIGAIPYVLHKLGNPPIYTTEISKEIILRRQEDFPNSPKPAFVIVKGKENHRLGEFFSVTFFDVIHNIPEGVGMIFHTPIGNVVHPGEFKFDYDNEGKPRGLRVLGLELMEDLRERVVSKVEIRLRSEELTEDSLGKLRELVAQSPGECRTKILVNGEGYAATLRVGRRFGVRATPKFVDGVRSLFGRTDALVLEE